MHTPDPYHGTGSMMEAAEIPVKQYNAAPALGTTNGGSSGMAEQNRAQANSSRRRSSSGVYDDEGLASAAAMAALHKQDLCTGGLHSPEAGKEQTGSGAAGKNGQMGNGNGMSPPRQRLNVSDSATEIAPDAGGFNFPKTLRRQPQQEQADEPIERPHIPVHQRSLRHPSTGGTRSSITSYIRLSRSRNLPTPGRLLSHHTIPQPEPVGPAGAKAMRRPGAAASMDNEDSAMDLPPPQGASAAGLMTDYGGSSTQPNPADIPVTKTTTPSRAPHGAKHLPPRPQNTSGGLYTTEAGELSQEKPHNPYMPQPPSQQSGDLADDFQDLNIEGEGAYISKKTLRHPADVPKQQKGEPSPPPKVPLSEKTLRRPSSSNGKSGMHGLLGMFRGGSSQSPKQPPHTSPQQQQQREQSYQSESAAMNIGQGVDTTIHETIDPAVVHEHVTPVIRNEEQEVIDREIHNYDVYDRILPVREHINLPPRHYTPDGQGRLHEMQPEEVSAVGMDGLQMSQPHQQDRILVSETKVTSPGGTTRTESVWRYPAAGEDVTSATNFTNQTNTNNSSENMSNINATANPKPAPSAATSSRPDTVRTISRTPHDGDVLVSQPLHSLDSPGPTPTGHGPLEYSGPISGMSGAAMSSPGMSAGAPVNTPGLPSKSPNRTLSAAAMAANAATAIGSPAATSHGMSQSPSGGQNMGTVTMGGSTAPGVPPPLPTTHQQVHATGRNDLGPTHHTDIDQLRADTHINYGGLDSEAYMGPGFHPSMDSQGLSYEIHNAEARETIRRPSVAREWGAVPKPRKLKHERDEHSPVGARPSRPTPSPRMTMRGRSRESAPTLRQRLGARLHTTGQRIPSANDVGRLASNAQHNVQQRMPSSSQVRTTSQRFVPTRDTINNNMASTERLPSTQQMKTAAMNTQSRATKNLPGTQNLPSAEQMKNAAMNAQSRATANLPSSEALKHAAIEAQNRVAASMPETTKAAKQIRKQPGMAAKFAGNIASNIAEGVWNLMPEHLTTELYTPQIPGAYDSGTDHYTHSDENYERDSLSSDSSLSSPLDVEPMPLSKRKSSVGGDAPTTKQLENMVIPGGVVKGAHAIVGPSVLMENKKVEEEMSLKRLRRLSKHEHDAVAMLSDANGKTTKGVREHHRENKQQMQKAQHEPTLFEREQSMASKMHELQIAETEREIQQSERIQQKIEKNILRDEHDEFERAKQIRREADRALQEAKKTQLPDDIDLAHKLEKEYQSSIKQNQKVLKEAYRSGLGVTVRQGIWETTKVHSGRLDGVQEGTGPIGFSPTHTTFPTGFERDMHTEPGMMGEGTESENPWNYHPPSNTAPNHPVNRPKTRPIRTTGNVITNHSVFPNPGPIEPSSVRKSKTITPQPITKPFSQRTISQRFVKPAKLHQSATNRSPTIIATQMAEGSHSVRHPVELNVQQHMTRPLDHNAKTPTNALELDPIEEYTQPIHHPVDLGMHTQAIPIDPQSHRIAKDPVHPHTSMNIPMHQGPMPIKTKAVRHPLAREGSQAMPIGEFPSLTQPLSHEDVGTPTQAVPIDPLTHTIPKDPLHVVDSVVSPLNPLAPSPSGEERKRDIGVVGSPTDMGRVTTTMDTLASPGENFGRLSKSQRKKMKRKMAREGKEKEREMELLNTPLLSRDTPSPMPAEAERRMERAMHSPLSVKEPAGIARPGANTVVEGVRPMSWASVVAEGELERKVEERGVRML